VWGGVWGGGWGGFVGGWGGGWKLSRENPESELSNLGVRSEGAKELKQRGGGEGNQGHSGIRDEMESHALDIAGVRGQREKGNRASKAGIRWHYFFSVGGTERRKRAR